jgi:hypothetical protein
VEILAGGAPGKIPILPPFEERPLLFRVSTALCGVSDEDCAGLSEVKTHDLV